MDNHAFIYENACSVKVRLTDGSTAGFPQSANALSDAVRWAIERADSIEIRG